MPVIPIDKPRVRSAHAASYAPLDTRSVCFRVRAFFAMVGAWIALCWLAAWVLPGAVTVCNPIEKSLLKRYTDLASYPMRTPDMDLTVVLLRDSPGARSGVEILACESRARAINKLVLPSGPAEMGESVEHATDLARRIRGIGRDDDAPCARRGRLQ